jgi:hypothetical protein
MSQQSLSYDHPSYLTRVNMKVAKTVAGASGVSGITPFANNIRIRNVIAAVATAGTATTNTLNILAIGTATKIVNGVGTQVTGTNTLGTIALSTSALYATATSGDLNAIINAGSLLAIQNGADATGVAEVVAEVNLDPSATITV